MKLPITAPVFSHQQAHASGWTMYDLSREVRAGTLMRPRRGYFARPDAPADLIRAARVGGCATAATALRQLGVWTAPNAELHVWMPPHAGRIHDPDSGAPVPASAPGLCLHYSARFAPDRTPLNFTPTAPIAVALAHAAECWDLEYVVAAGDSAVQRKLIGMEALAAMRVGASRRSRDAFELIDGRCESGIESISRVRLLLAGLRVDSQVAIARVGRVDLVVEGRVVVELDGREFHTGEDRFRQDRDRDLQLRLLGFTVLRFTYDQVMYAWADVERAIRLAVAQAA